MGERFLKWVETLEVHEVYRSVKGELQALETYMAKELQGRDDAVEDVARYLLNAGGKRIRPALVFLAGQFGHYDPDVLRPLAAATEFIHMATLAHDDVIDEAELRRGVPTVNARWNARISVLAGDYLFAKAFSLLASTGNPEVVGVMAHVVDEMCQGEIDQNLQSMGQKIPDEATYLDRIGKKTALFLAESCRSGALLAGADEKVTRALYTFGWGVGIGFQIVDDVLDFTATSLGFGKARGTDLKSGVITLPLIHAFLTSPQKKRLERLALSGAGGVDVEEVTGILGQSGSFDYAENLALDYVQQAKSTLLGLPACPAREALLSMANFVLERKV